MPLYAIVITVLPEALMDFTVWMRGGEFPAAPTDASRHICLRNGPVIGRKRIIWRKGFQRAKIAVHAVKASPRMPLPATPEPSLAMGLSVAT